MWTAESSGLIRTGAKPVVERPQPALVQNGDGRGDGVLTGGDRDRAGVLRRKPGRGTIFITRSISFFFL